MRPRYNYVPNAVRYLIPPQQPGGSGYFSFEVHVC